MSPLRSTLGRSLGRLIKLGRTKDLAGEGTGGAALEGQLNSKYYGSRSQSVENVAYIEATGGTLSTPGNGYRYHFITSSGSFAVSSLATQPTDNVVDYFMVAGGGSGAGEYSGPNQVTGGGGGAGGVLTASSHPITETSYPIVIGSGGAQPNPAGRTAGQAGGVTTAFGKTAYGGGGGGTYPSTGSTDGGSGGGSGRRNTSTYKYGLNPTTPAPVIANFPAYEPGTTQGYPGGIAGGNSNDGGGGGGGAGSVGEDGFPDGSGGTGVTAFSGDTGIPTDYGTPGPTTGRWFGGGGGAGINAGGTGGAGGGADAPGPTLPGGAYGNAGTTNTGGGGSGGRAGTPGDTDGNTKGGAGGPGICIIRYSYE